MRKIISEARFSGSTDIGEIKLDMKCRDNVPTILIGLQAIWKGKKTQAEMLGLLDERTLPGKRRAAGRPGMALQGFW